MDIKEDKPVSGVWYLLGGLAVGTAVGLLVAPKKGSESREDIAAWGRRGGEKARALLASARGEQKHAAGRSYAQSKS
ncbi:MAG: YtxH domain-containing protein [Elusimicrobia bacterium]|nr:YtxH domain-containing protein [Elusimicrobiota bacterium]